MSEPYARATLIYRCDDVVVKSGVVQLDGGYMPVNYRIGSTGPERDDRRREEQILEHITGALQESFGQSSGAARAPSDSSTASPCAHRRGRALGLWLPIFAAILAMLASSAAAAQVKPVSEFLQTHGPDGLA